MSKLDAHSEFILGLAATGAKWTEIAARLADEKGVQITGDGVAVWIRRRVKRIQRRAAVVDTRAGQGPVIHIHNAAPVWQQPIAEPPTRPSSVSSRSTGRAAVSSAPRKAKRNSLVTAEQTEEPSAQQKTDLRAAVRAGTKVDLSDLDAEFERQENNLPWGSSLLDGDR